jgi:hypothetical protein
MVESSAEVLVKEERWLEVILPLVPLQSSFDDGLQHLSFSIFDLCHCPLQNKITGGIYRYFYIKSETAARGLKQKEVGGPKEVVPRRQENKLHGAPPISAH